MRRRNAESQVSTELVVQSVGTGLVSSRRLAKTFDVRSCRNTMTKQRRAHRVPISDETATIVRQRQLLVPKGSPWLFPGDTPGQPVQEVRRFWAQVQKQCGLSDVRIHDLRHTFASLLVSGGASLEMIGKLLGHSQMQTTLRYAHLMDSPLRAGVDAVASAFRPKPRLVHDADDQGGRKTA